MDTLYIIAGLIVLAAVGIPLFLNHYGRACIQREDELRALRRKYAALIGARLLAEGRISCPPDVRGSDFAEWVIQHGEKMCQERNLDLHHMKHLVAVAEDQLHKPL